MLIDEKSFIQPSIFEVSPHPLIICKTTQNLIKAQNKLEDTKIQVNSSIIFSTFGD